MNLPPPSIRDLAQRLLTAEAASQSSAQSHVPEAVRVCEKLRISLTRFAGSAGFTALMRRALVLARVEFPALQNVEVQPDGSLEGIEQLASDPSHAGVNAATAIAAHLLGLLVNFVGEPIMLRLVHDAWPAASLDA